MNKSPSVGKASSLPCVIAHAPTAEPAACQPYMAELFKATDPVTREGPKAANRACWAELVAKQASPHGTLIAMAASGPVARRSSA